MCDCRQQRVTSMGAKRRAAAVILCLRRAGFSGTARTLAREPDLYGSYRTDARHGYAGAARRIVKDARSPGEWSLRDDRTRAGTAPERALDTGAVTFALSPNQQGADG